MGQRALATLLQGGSFFEGPRWHGGRWFVSDFYRHAVVAVTPQGAEETVMEVPGQPSGLGWMPDGSMLAVSMRDHRLLRRSASGDVTEHADLTPFCRGHLNDMVVDARGHAYAGNFGFDLMAGEDPRTATLVHVDLDGGVSVAAEDIVFPNGSVITPDGSTLIVGETLACRYSAFTIAADGSLGDRRVWAQIAPSPELGPFGDMVSHITVAPDGCCLDAEGHIWAADAVGARCIRVAPGGAIVDEVRAPAGLGAFACMLGGDDGRTLLLCCAPDYFEHLRSQAREAVLLTTTVDVPHAGLP